MLHCARRGLSDALAGLRVANKVVVFGGTEGQSVAADHLQNFQLPCLQTFYHQTQRVHSSSSPQSAASGQNAPMPPWTPTAQLTKRKVLTKRMGFLLQASQDCLCGCSSYEGPHAVSHCFHDQIVLQVYLFTTDAGGRASCSCG